jgi:uncharacterized membrane protein YphA (DoxX/SURF4 family)
MMRALTLFLAIVLLLSAGHKAQAPDRLATATGRLAGVSGPLATLLMVLAGAVEAVAALCLVLPGAQTAGALIATGLWLTYAIALWRRHGAVLDCGCDLVARPRAVGAAQVARPLSLAMVALAIGLWPFAASSEPIAIDVMAAFGAVALYLATLEIMAIPYPRWRTS